MSKRLIDIESIRTSLNVDYCISGSIRSLKNDIVVDADFVETATGQILWTRQFSGSRSDFLELVPEGIGQIVRAIGGAIADRAIDYVRQRELADLEDHYLLVAGVSLMHRPSLSAFAKSRELIEEAGRRSPRSAEAQAWLGKWYILSVFNRWSTNISHDTQMAVDATARALDIDPENSFCLTIDGFAHNNLMHQLDTADIRYSHALDLNPNESLAWLLKGTLHAFQDDGSSAVAAVERARMLSPIDPFGYYYDSLSATAYFANGDYECALEHAERSLAVNDRHVSTIRAKITALCQLNRLEEAREAGADLLARQPNLTVSKYLSQHPAAGNRLGLQVAEALREVGIPRGD